MSTLNSPHSTIWSLGHTDRKDAWWVAPLLTAAVLGLFVVYATYAGLSNAYYEVGPYLSPFYSPTIRPEWLGLPSFISPAIFILAFPAGFRATCYYYRKAYYRAFFFDPPACAVGEGRGTGYKGERSFPFVLQNLHRFFMYFAVLFWAILTYDAIIAFWHNGAFYLGVGSLVMIANVVLLGLYTFGCHSVRHLIGGKHDCFSCMVGGKTKHDAWRGVSWLNERHQLFAWLSLFSVGLTDLYIRLLAMGKISPAFDALIGAPIIPHVLY